MKFPCKTVLTCEINDISKLVLLQSGQYQQMITATNLS